MTNLPRSLTAAAFAITIVGAASGPAAQASPRPTRHPPAVAA